ncbi:MAG: DUF58 domain-containing protein [Deltaproteobacteria bacterium]|nr:DUF58 domain-containing protein [Deltaproteobacteria bacterium]
MLSRWRRWLARLVPVVELFPLTPLGAAVLVGGYLVLQRYGYRHRDLVLFALGALAVLLVGVALVVTLMGTLFVRRALARTATPTVRRLECERWSASGFGFAAPSLIPLLTVMWRWDERPVQVRQRRARGRLEEEVRPVRRASVPRVSRRFEIGDAFGLARIVFHRVEACALSVLPSTGALRQPQVIRGLASGSDQSHADGRADGDPFDTRRYAPGDPIRFVLWKVFAKSRALIVRTPERALSPVEHTVAYLVSGRGDEPSAGAARIALDVGAFGEDWRIGADGSRTLARTKEEAMALLAESADVSESDAGIGLGRFLDEAGALGRLVVFVPPRPGPWLGRVSALVRDHGRRVDFVIGTDGFDVRPKVRRLLERTDDLLSLEQGTPLEELRAVVRALGGGARGARVVVVDRRTGHAYLPEQLPRSSSSVGEAA